MRSWLVIEANNADKLSKAPMVGAEAIVVDLADVPIDDTADEVREAVCEWLTTYTDPLVAKRAFARWVRIKPTDAPLWREDLVAVMRGAPDGVILPKTCGPEDIRMLASELYEIEQKLGLKHNSTKIMPQIGETPRAALTLQDLTNDPQPRLTGFTWNAANLARRLSAKRTHDALENWTGALQYVRSMTLLLAKAMGVMALETATSEESSANTCFGDAQAAKHDGFTGMFATRPKHIKAINEAYSMSLEEKAEAEAMINSFAAQKKAMLAEGEIKPPSNPLPGPVAEMEEEPAQKLRAIG